MPRHERDRAGNVTAGLILITIGVLFLSGELGLASIRQLWRYWPLALIAIGITHLALGESEDRWNSGVMNLLLGVVFLAINFHWLDLDWGTGWPLVLVAVGAGMMLRAVFKPRRRRDRTESGAVVVEENRHD